LNTFSVADYIKVVADGQSLQALATRLNAGDKMAYWLFWQCYKTVIDTEAFRSLFNRDLPQRVKVFLSLLVFMGLAHREGTVLRLTDTGAYIFHLIEQGYTHAYLETLWQACFQEAWPRKVVL
jgi:oxygen-independent coproporphyrinogen-3 oxidase